MESSRTTSPHTQPHCSIQHPALSVSLLCSYSSPHDGCFLHSRFLPPYIVSVRENDVLPFFIHCDDVEYGLRCGRPPIIIKGVQVWHETFEHRQTPIMLYYDTRNPLFVNEVYGLDEDRQEVLDKWKQKISLYHVNKDFISEYYVIKAMDDYLKGLPWLYKVDPARNHSKLQKTKIYKVKNSVLWRIVVHKYRRKYKM